MAEADRAAAGVVADLWRFPVKSFGGERLRRAFAGPFGLIGDRRYALVDPAAQGEVLTARRAPGLLGFRARYAERDAADGLVVTTPDGLDLPDDDPELAAAAARAAGRAAELVRSPGAVHDAAPLHIVGQGSLAALAAWLGGDADVRRLRPNIVVELADPAPFAEDAWVGGRIRVGEAEAEVVSPTERCAVTTFDPDTRDRDTEVLAHIARRRDNLFGVYARVATPGWIAVGDPVRLLP